MCRLRAREWGPEEAELKDSEGKRALEDHSELEGSLGLCFLFIQQWGSQEAETLGTGVEKKN